MTNVEFTNNYKTVENILFRFAIKLTKSEAAAKDLLQDTALKAFSKRNSFNGVSPFKSWISTIMYNTFINSYRSKKRRRKMSEAISAKNALSPNSNATSNKGFMRLLKNDLEKHVAAVGPKCKKALKLHMDGYQYKEISEMLKIPTGTVKSRINYARQKTQKSIVKMGLYRLQA